MCMDEDSSAYCQQHEINIDIFFDKNFEDLAKMYCGRCPLKDMCAYLNKNEVDGIFGGLTPKQRHQLPDLNIDSLTLSKLRNQLWRGQM
jgi:hypothetical protein